jgi:hypothetical protein
MQELRIIHNKVSPTNIFYLLTSASDGTSTQVTAPRNDSDSTSLVISREKVIVEILSNEGIISASLNSRNTLDLKHLHTATIGVGIDEDFSASSKSSISQVDASAGSNKRKSDTSVPLPNSEDLAANDSPLRTISSALFPLINQLSRNGFIPV